MGQGQQSAAHHQHAGQVVITHDTVDPVRRRIKC
jgi:hypothetical protein